jgi:uncharacterized membrane protein
MTIHLPPFFTLFGVLAATVVLSGLVFTFCMLFAWGSDWAARVAVPATVLTAVVSAVLFFRFAGG